MALDIDLIIDGETAEVHLAGELDASTVTLFQTELEKLRAHKLKRLILQVERLEYLGCAGVRMFLFVKQKISSRPEVHVIGPRKQVMDTLKRAGLHHSFVIVPAAEPSPGTRGTPAAGAMRSLSVPAVLDSLKPVGEYALSAATAAGLAEQAAGRLRLAVEEIATNVITHGLAGTASPGTIDLRADVEPARLRVILEDTGEAFDPRQAPAPTDLERPAEQRAAGGLGIHMALQGVDKFQYERLGGRNRHVFVMNRSGD